MKRLLRSEAEVALDEVTEYCKLALDHYRTAARLTDHDDLVQLFSSLAQKKRRWVEELETQIRRLGNLPSAPDADREAFEHLALRIRAAFTEERTALLHESDRMEQALIEKAEDALEKELPVEIRPLVKKISEESKQVRNLLKAG